MKAITYTVKLFDNVRIQISPGKYHYGHVVSCSNNRGKCLVSGHGPAVFIKNIELLWNADFKKVKVTEEVNEQH